MYLEGKNYCGLTIDLNDNKEYVNISMSTYISKYHKRFLLHESKNSWYAPHKWTVPAYGQSTQYEKWSENNLPINAKGKNIYKPALSHYCTTHDHFIKPWYLIQMRYLIVNPNPLFTKGLLLICYLITPTRTLMQKYVTTPATWLCMPDQMPLIYSCQRITVASMDINI